PYNISTLSAFPGVDFDAKTPLSGFLTFRPAVRTQSITIPTINNNKVDGDRSLSIALGTPTGGAQLASPSTALVTITNYDQAGMFLVDKATYSVREGGSVVVDIVQLPTPGNSGPLGGNPAVRYKPVNGNASAGIDFEYASYTVVFGPLDT